MTDNSNSSKNSKTMLKVSRGQTNNNKMSLLKSSNPTSKSQNQQQQQHHQQEKGESFVYTNENLGLLFGENEDEEDDGSPDNGDNDESEEDQKPIPHLPQITIQSVGNISAALKYNGNSEEQPQVRTCSYYSCDVNTDQLI